MCLRVFALMYVHTYVCTSTYMYIPVSCQMLALHLEELGPVVDWFFLVEATWTFTDQDKPLYFGNHRDQPRFAKWKHKIQYVTLDRGTLTQLKAPVTAWAREHLARDMGMSAVRARASPGGTCCRVPGDALASCVAKLSSTGIAHVCG